MELLKRKLEKEEKQSFFLLGPRGTGKSTYIKNEYPDALLVDLLQPDDFRAYSSKPERLRELVHGNPDRSVFVLDEIQKVPDLLGVVHALIEEKKGRQFILTGSSARKLKRTGVNLLAGRAVMKHLHPFIAGELGNRFKLNDALKIGLIPLILGSAEPKEALSAYIDLYIKEEIKSEGLTRNIGNFTRFLETVAFSHGSVINISNVARECQIERKTVEGYLSILEDILLAFRIPVFQKKAKRSLASHPKFYLFDAGVFFAIRPAGPADSTTELEGAALEGLVAQHLRAHIDYRAPDCKLSFWRTYSGSEVDFIVYGKDTFWAIEVKSAREAKPEHLRGLQAFAEDFPQAEKFLLYRGKDRLNIDGINLLPCEDFLSTLG
ncbi:ATP-binding protein [Candidatus Saganbacteria bacterium]|nr:ATP-binding protein [Candidatus Saganbacteria bacterium]